MAGVGVLVETVEIDDAAALAALARLRAAGEDASPAFDEIGNYMVNRTLERFEAQQGPGGVPWTPLAPATIARKGHDRILFRTGRLMRSISYSYGADYAEFGTNVIYGAIQQFGGKAGRGRKVTIPPRPFLGVDDVDREEIGVILSDFVAREWDEGAPGAAP